MDASSSMYSKQKEVFDGTNKSIQNIQKLNSKNKDQKHDIIVGQFSETFKVLKNEKAKGCELLKEGDYEPNGMTALCDAISQGFNLIPKDTDGATITIFTDGQENASQEANMEDCRKLIEKARKKNWSVVFMGCDEKAMESARSMGVSMANTVKMSNDGKGFARGMATMDTAMSYYSTNFESIKKGKLSADDVLNKDIDSNEREDG